jgi:hypothetical protein
MLHDNSKWLLAAMLFFLITFGSALLIVDSAFGDSLPGTVMEKVKNPDSWMGDTALKWGFVGVATGTNMLRMLSEADQFDSRDLISPSAHHAVDTGIIAGLVATGILLYAVVERDSWTWQEKAWLIGGTGLTCWEVGDGTYKLSRWENWWDNDPAHNRNNIPWYDYDHGFRDAFKGTGRVSTMLLHVGRTAGGAYCIGKAH